MPRGKAVVVTLTETERANLDALLRRHGTKRSMAQRGRIVLLAAEGLTNTEIASRLGINKHTAGKWRNRFVMARLEGLRDEPRPGASRQIGDDQIAETIRMTLESRPADAAHWSLRSMARATGYSPSTIHRIWRAFGLQPHRQETFKPSRDPVFVEKLCDIVALYRHPPDRAVVLCLNEKPQTHALARTVPLSCPNSGELRSRNGEHRGTISVPTALDLVVETVNGTGSKHQRVTEFHKFLDHVEANLSVEFGVHILIDAPAAHMANPIRDLFAKRPNWHVHFAPTSASWRNEVERLFALLTDKAQRRGVQRSTAELEAAIHAYLEADHAGHTTFCWTKSADSIHRSCFLEAPRRWAGTEVNT